jgi:hypothetical protein
MRQLQMRYVMVPVPSEHVLDVMRWVLFRAPNEDVHSGMRDAARIQKLADEADDTTRTLLRLVADATVTDTPLRLTDVADELDQEPAALNELVRALNSTALGAGRELVRVSNEPGVGVFGKVGAVSFLVMRAEHARLVRSTIGPPGGE